MEKIKVGILRGGEGPEYDSSLKIGGYILQNLPEDKYEPCDILVTKDGVWHVWGIPSTPADAMHRVDVVFNVVIGTSEKEHTIQKIIEHFKKPFIGSDALSKAVAHTRHVARKALASLGIKTPYHKVTYPGKDAEDLAFEVFNTLSPPWRVRFSNEFSHDNAIEVNSYKNLVQVISDLQQYGRPIVVEEYIKGETATCFVVEGTDGVLRTYSVGGDGAVSEAARRAHEALGLRHFSKANFVLSPKRGAYLTSVYAHPDLHETSPFVRQLGRQNIELSDYIDHLVCLALK